MFIELGEYFFNVDDVIAIKRVGSGASVVTKGGTYPISNVEEKQWEKLSCCSSPYFCTLTEEEK